MSSEEPIFVIKSSPCQQPWRSVCRRGCRPQQAQKKALHVNSKVTLTVNGNFCSSISRNEHGRSFMSTRRDGLHSLTYIHYDGAEAHMPRTPRHRHAKQLHERPNYQVHTCCQYIGEVILAQLEDHTGKPCANVEATSDTLRCSCSHRRECPAITYMAMGFRPRSFPVGGMYVKGVGRLTKVKKNHSLLFSIAS